MGALIGLLLTLCFAAGQLIGASSGIAKISALIEMGISSTAIQKGSLFEKLLSNQIIFDWKLLFVLAIPFGSWAATRLTKEPTPKKNLYWARRFGTSRFKRFIAAFIGGCLLMIGARLAGGCTSGHAISGGAQTSIVSWIFMIVLFATAIPVSFLLYKKPN